MGGVFVVRTLFLRWPGCEGASFARKSSLNKLEIWAKQAPFIYIKVKLANKPNVLSSNHFPQSMNKVHSLTFPLLLARTSPPAIISCSIRASEVMWRENYLAMLFRKKLSHIDILVSLDLLGEAYSLKHPFLKLSWLLPRVWSYLWWLNSYWTHFSAQCDSLFKNLLEWHGHFLFCPRKYLQQGEGWL